MNSSDFSLQNYLKCLINIEPNFSTKNEKFVKCMTKIASCWFDIGFIRWYHIKEIRSILINEEMLKEFSIHLIKSLKPMAYMKDCGEIHISLGALLFKSNMATIKVLSHELAHIWLSQQDFYPSLKALNKEFKQSYKMMENINLLSPIELFAMIISVDIMESIKESLKGNLRKRINKFIDLENEKIKEIKDTLLNL